jgi:hypothetical protein
MQAQVQKKQEDKSQVNSKNSSQKKEEGTLEFFDQRPEVSFRQEIQKKADTSPRAWRSVQKDHWRHRSTLHRYKGSREEFHYCGVNWH